MDAARAVADEARQRRHQQPVVEPRKAGRLRVELGHPLGALARERRVGQHADTMVGDDQHRLVVAAHCLELGAGRIARPFERTARTHRQRCIEHHDAQLRAGTA